MIEITNLMLVQNMLKEQGWTQTTLEVNIEVDKDGMQSFTSANIIPRSETEKALDYIYITSAENLQDILDKIKARVQPLNKHRSAGVAPDGWAVAEC